MLDTSTRDAYLRGEVLSLVVPAEPGRKVDVHVFASLKLLRLSVWLE